MISAFDLVIVEWLYTERSPVLLKTMMIVTGLGEGVVVIIITLGAAGVLWYLKRCPYAVGLLASVAGGTVAAQVIKLIVHRARPPIELHAIFETGYSFPSYHSVAAVALWGFLAIAAWRLGIRNRPLILASSISLILLIGFSRVYLGVHYPTDVLGGFVVGGIFAALGIWTVRKIEKSR